MSTTPFQKFIKIKTYTGKICTVRDIKIRASELKHIVASPYKAITEPLTEKEQAKYDKWTAEGKQHLDTFQKLQNKLDNVNLINISSTVVNNFYNKYVLGFDSFTGTKDTDRGTNQEQDSIDLFNKVYNSSYIKNTERKTNDYLTGEPDIVSEAIGDIKTRRDWVTFTKRTSQNDIDDHFWQLWAYGQLFNKKEGAVINALPNYPEEFIQFEISKHEGDEARQKQVYYWYNYDRINPKARIKMTRIDLTLVDSELVYKILDQFYIHLNELAEYNKDLLV